jgi:hypothetical protein
MIDNLKMMKSVGKMKQFKEVESVVKEYRMLKRSPTVPAIEAAKNT